MSSIPLDTGVQALLLFGYPEGLCPAHLRAPGKGGHLIPRLSGPSPVLNQRPCPTSSEDHPPTVLHGVGDSPLRWHRSVGRKDKIQHQRMSLQSTFPRGSPTARSMVWDGGPYAPPKDGISLNPSGPDKTQSPNLGHFGCGCSPGIRTWEVF